MDKELQLDDEKRQEIIDSLSTIKQLCMDCDDCIQCPIYSEKYKECLFQVTDPDKWILREPTMKWRAIE